MSLTGKCVKSQRYIMVESESESERREWLFNFYLWSNLRNTQGYDSFDENWEIKDHPTLQKNM